MKTQFKRLHLDRLIKLAEHLTRGKLAHEQWNILSINSNGPGMSDEHDFNNGLAKVGNALGELPIVFPDLFYFAPIPYPLYPGKVDYVPILKDEVRNKFASAKASTCRFFQIDDNEFDLLFTPYHQASKLMLGWFQLSPMSGVDEQAYNLWRYAAEKATAMQVTVKIPAL